MTAIERAARKASSFFDVNAWLLMVVGITLFALRVQFEPGGWVNLPVVFTVLQTLGLFLAVSGIQIIVSRIFWPTIDAKKLMEWVAGGSSAAACVLLGLLIFNGLGVVASVMWLTNALGAGLTTP